MVAARGAPPAPRPDLGATFAVRGPPPSVLGGLPLPPPGGLGGLARVGLVGGASAPTGGALKAKKAAPKALGEDIPTDADVGATHVRFAPHTQAVRLNAPDCLLCRAEGPSPSSLYALTSRAARFSLMPSR